MRKAFLEYLVAEGAIPPKVLGAVRAVLRAAPEPIGSIAFGYGLVTGGDIDVILDEQRANYRPFGEIAVSRGLLTHAQVQTLLAVQQVRAATETAEALALSGMCPIERIMPQLGRFLSQAQNSILCTQS